MATHMSDTGGIGCPTEMLEMDWSYRPTSADVKETGCIWRQLERLAQDIEPGDVEPTSLAACLRRGDEGFDWLVGWLVG